MESIFDRQIVPSPCPACGAPLDHAASDEDVAPRPGDFTLCMECAALLVFDESMILRLPTQAQRQVAESSPRLVAARRTLGQMIYMRQFDPGWKDRPNG